MFSFGWMPPHPGIDFENKTVGGTKV